MKNSMIITGIACLAMTACATKTYPVSTGLSSAETQTYSCQQLDVELGKANEVQAKIAETAQTNWRSVAGFMIDYGIGNYMAKKDADEAVAARISEIETTKVSKGCV